MSTTRTGIVVRAQSRAFTVLADGDELDASVPGRMRYEDDTHVDPVAVGDRVDLERSEDRWVVAKVHPRRNAISRPASGRRGRRQVVAANLDHVVVVLAVADPPWKPATIDRYLVMASYADIAPVICLNKIDLEPAVLDDPRLEAYRDLGIPVVAASAEEGTGVDRLRAALGTGVAALIGPSGVGKSSLVNRLVPGSGLRTGEVSSRTGKGQHTTTWVEMLDMEGGGHLVDSPGLRVLDLSGVEPEDLDGHFAEIAARRDECKFHDCRHLKEPKCAVQAAVKSGEIAEHRYDSYQRIFESLTRGEG